MDIQKVIMSLNVLKEEARNVLDSQSPILLEQAVHKLQKAADTKAKQWGYEFKEKPLRFSRVSFNGYSLQPDIICSVQWDDKSPNPISQDVVLRVWSDDSSLVHRTEFDSDSMFDRIAANNGRRVMLRCHFDLANPSQDGPKFHVQIGGKAPITTRGEEELGWFPKEIDLPRICHQPMDLVLVTQLVVANFFSDKYRPIFHDPNIKGILKTSEESVLTDYYTKCLSAIKDRRTSVLAELWNTGLPS